MNNDYLNRKWVSIHVWIHTMKANRHWKELKTTLLNANKYIHITEFFIKEINYRTMPRVNRLFSPTNRIEKAAYNHKLGITFIPIDRILINLIFRKNENEIWKSYMTIHRQCNSHLFRLQYLRLKTVQISGLVIHALVFPLNSSTL